MKVKIRTLLLLAIAYLLPVFSYSQDIIVGKKSNTWALIVAIKEYPDPNIANLKFTVTDAQKFKAFLKSDAGGNVPDSLIFTLNDSEATVNNIKKNFRKIFKLAEEGDRIFFYFSGHGDRDVEYDEEVGYLLTYHAMKEEYYDTALPLTEVQNFASRGSKKADMVIILDACKSGQLKSAGIVGNMKVMENIQNQKNLLSCRPNEESLEGTEWGGGRGLFSYYLEKALYGEADEDEDGMVSYYELEEYIRDNVKIASGRKQNPIIRHDSEDEIVSKVDDALLAAVKDGVIPTPNSESRNSKGFAEDDINKVFIDKTNDHKLFEKAIEEGRLLNPKEDCAYKYLDILLENQELKKFHEIFKDDLAFALQDSAMWYVRKLIKNYNKENLYNDLVAKDTFRFAEHLTVAAELLGADDITYPKVMASKFFFDGLNFLYKDKLKEAIEALNNGLYHDISAPNIHVYLGIAHRRMVWYDLPQDRTERMKKSAYHFDQAIKYAPRWAFPYTQKAELYYQIRGGVKNMIALLEKAIEVNPNFTMAYWELGRKYTAKTRIQDFDIAEKHFLKGLEIDDSYFFILDELARINLRKVMRESDREKRKEYSKKAKEYLLRAIIAKPEYRNANLNLGLAHHNLGEFEKAEAQFRKVMGMKGDDISSPYYHLGNLYMDDKKYADAESMYLEALTRTPDRNQTHWKLTQAALLQKNVDNAYTYLQMALENPTLKITKTNLESPLLSIMKEDADRWEFLIKDYFPELIEERDFIGPLDN